jgi:hypothetical protein
MSYQRKELSTDTNVGNPGPLPPELVGLADESLADIEKAVGHEAAEQLGYLDTGFFPEAPPAPPPGSVSQTQFHVAADNLGFYGAITTAAETAGGETLIRWQTQVVLSPDQAWLHDLCVTGAGLSEDEYTSIFTAAAAVVDVTRSLF